MIPVSRLELQTAEVTTPVWVGAGALRLAVSELDPILAGRRVFAVTSPPIRRLHGGALDLFATQAGDYRLIEVADGEAAKSIESATGLWRELLRAGGKRDSLVLAFGGGSVGDLAGFVAATFLRGIDYVQIPTTLLAQVDAAIGGKTAINVPEAKNSIGAFHHPVATIADTLFLETVPDRQLRSGLLEVVKTAAVLDAELFAVLERTVEDLLSGDPQSLAPVVEATVAAKISVVERDPREADLRQLLNFGHTLGHALESSALAASGEHLLEHGEAVGYGMLFATDLAAERGLANNDAERIRALIRRIGLPSLPGTCSPESVVDRLRRDKKAREDGLRWVLPQAIGEGRVFDDLETEAVIEKVGFFLASASGC